MLRILFLASILLAGHVARSSPRADLEQSAKLWLEEYNTQSSLMYEKVVKANWAYATNITDYNRDQKLAASAEEADYSKQAQVNASTFLAENEKQGNIIKDELTYRALKYLSVIGDSVLNDTMYKELSSNLVNMQSIYSKGKICSYKNTTDCNQRLEPELTRILASSRDYDELLWVWQKWRDVTKVMRPKYMDFVKLTNQASQQQGYSDTGARWRGYYSKSLTDKGQSLEADVDRVWMQLLPLYEQLHAYVRRRLFNLYKDKIDVKGAIPAHVLGNMWAQNWNHIYNDSVPFAGKESLDITDAMVEQKVTVKQMFNISDQFFKDLGLVPLPQRFWDHSMLTRPDDGREVVCHASAWNFFNGKDFRIKMCTDITMQDLITIHHEMGHVQYYLQYQDKPVAFQSGANPGFHEAVGDVLALSVATPAHLKKIGFLDSVTNDTESDINFLYNMALSKIAFLPFGLLMDKWRWGVYGQDYTNANLNKAWWDLRFKYQGLKPPVARSENDFDPAAKYHISSNTPYIRYFVSFVIQFQFHRALCKLAGQEPPAVPLHKCDIDGSKAAGKKLGEMLALGSSKSWPEALKLVTGDDKMDASAIIQYFQPLTEWLKKQNEKETIGWGYAWPTEPPTTTPSGVGKVKSSFVQVIIALVVLLGISAAGFQ